MTEQNPYDTHTTGGSSMPEEPLPESGARFGDTGSGGSFGDSGTDATGANARAREWLGQLEAMIQDIATQAAPVAKQVGAKAAELAAAAATKAGPMAHKAAEVTTDAGQRFAERAQAVAAELRGEPGASAPTTPPAEPVTWDATSSSGTSTDRDSTPGA